MDTPRIDPRDAERVLRLLDETKESYDVLMEAKRAYELRRDALIGALNLVRVEAPGFDPLQDAVAVDGTIQKGGADERQKGFVASDHQLRQLARQQRLAGRTQ